MEIKDIKCILKNLIIWKPKKLVVPKRRYKKKSNNKNYKSKRRIIRHSKQMKDWLKKRVKVEHINSILHRSFKRLDRIFDKTITAFDGFIKLAMCMIIINTG